MRGATRRGSLVLVFGLLALGSAGCASRSTARYIPSSATARQSLEAALNAWQQGQPPGRIEGVSPPVQVADTRWKAGDKLGSYEILQEEPGDEQKWFSVRLKLQKPAGEQTVRYVVIGRDPVWVFREADYKKLSTDM
jgi:hypothetical protein